MVRSLLPFVLLLTFVTSHPAAVLGQNAPADRPAGTTGPTVNLNTATSAELQALPGIGVARANRILEYRQKNGPFKRIEEIMNVQGIGEKVFLRLKPQLTVGTPATPAGR